MKKRKNKDLGSSRKDLKWFIDFANMDLEESKKGTKKFIDECKKYLLPIDEMHELKKFPGSEAEVLDLPKYKFMSWVSDSSQIFKNHDKRPDEFWSLILNLQNVVQDHLKGFLHSVSPNGLVLHPGHETMIVRVHWRNKQPVTIDYLPITESQKDYVRFKIYQLMEGFPSHFIGFCKECEKLFLSETARKRIYCSDRCKWNFNTKKRRKDDPEGYKQYQRELMRDRYREKEGHPRLKTKSRK